MHLFIKILFIFGCTVYLLLLGLSLVVAGGESSLAAVCGAPPLQCKLSRLWAWAQSPHGVWDPPGCAPRVGWRIPVLSATRHLWLMLMLPRLGVLRAHRLRPASLWVLAAPCVLRRLPPPPLSALLPSPEPPVVRLITAFSGWLLPLSNVHLRAAMSVLGLIAQFSFSSLALNNSPPSGSHSLFIRSPAEGHLGSLYCLSGLLEWEVDSKQSPLLTSELSSDVSELLGRGGVATWTLVLCCPPFPRALDRTGYCSRTLQPSVQGTPEVPLGEAIPPTVRSW